MAAIWLYRVRRRDPLAGLDAGVSRARYSSPIATSNSRRQATKSVRFTGASNALSVTFRASSNKSRGHVEAAALRIRTRHIPFGRFLASWTRSVDRKRAC